MFCDKCGKPIIDGKPCDCQNTQVSNVNVAKSGKARKIWMGILSVIGAPIAIISFVFMLVFLVALALASAGDGDVTSLRVMVTVCLVFFFIGVITSNLFGVLSIVQYAKCKKRGLGNPIVTFILGIVGMAICDFGCAILLISGIS
jgi:hypothetical protein